MNVLSDTETSDSDTGRRYKTESTRYKIKSNALAEHSRHEDLVETNSHRYGCSKSKTRNRERDSSIRSRSPDKGNRKYAKNKSPEISSKKLNPHEKRSSNKLTDKDKHGNRYSHHISSSRGDTQKSSISSHKKSRSMDTDEKKDYSEKYRKNKREKLRANDECSSTDSSDRRRDNDTQFKTSYLPHKFNSPTKNGCQELQSSANENLMCGPSLPPYMLKTKPDHNTVDNVPLIPIKRTYGPSLPSFHDTYSEHSPLDDNNDESKTYDKNERACESEGEIYVGPVLEHNSNQNETYLKLEKRAIELKLAKLSADEKNDVHQEREEWMTSLPELRTVADQNLGVIAPRQFRIKVHDEIKDRSLWTETPGDRKSKAKKQDSHPDNLAKMNREKIEKMHRERRDAEQEDMVRKHKKKHKRDESLLKIHQKNMKKKSEKSVSVERRPFSRDTDLKVNRFDEAMKKSILKKAEFLDERFGCGKSKFL